MPIKMTTLNSHSSSKDSKIKSKNVLKLKSSFQMSRKNDNLTLFNLISELIKKLTPIKFILLNEKYLFNKLIK